MRAGWGLVSMVVALAIVAVLARRQGTALEAVPAPVSEPSAIAQPATVPQARPLPQQVQEQLDVLMQQRRAEPEE